jgi:uncharacterized membrane protein
MEIETKSPLGSEAKSGPSNLTIPARIIIGIAGPQKIEAKPGLIDAIHTAVEKITQMAPSLQSTRLVLSVLSTLTEDSDLLVAGEILKIPGSMLEVIVPLREESPAAYLERSASIKQFENMFPETTRARELPAKTYARVGSYIVDECDVLLAFWDGKSTDEQRGLGEVIDYARRNGCPIIWINTRDQGQVTVELGRGLNVRMLHDIEDYNSQRIKDKEFGKALLRQRSFFVSQAERTRLPLDKLSVTIEYFLPHLVRADILALRFQRLYNSTGSLIYLLSALAVFVAAFQSLFMSERPWILIIEIALMLIVLAIFFLGQRQRWHNKWLDYRFLAERLRSALFMALVNAGMTPSRRPRLLPLAFPPKAWMVAAFSTVWIKRPRFKTDDSVLSRELRDFVVRAWIDDQILYHKGISSRYYRRHRYMVLASFALFALTIIFVLLYVVLREFSGVSHDTFTNASGLIASFLPAVAASVTAIRTHRDYMRNSRLSAGMVRYLEEMKVQIEKATDHEDFLGLVKEIEETMQRENQDWRVEIRFHRPAVPR